MIDLTPIFQAIIALLAALVTYKLIPWIKSKTTKQQQENLFSAARIVVFAAEQVFGAGHGEEKLNYALAALRRAGFNIDAELAREAIERAVHEMNTIVIETVIDEDEDSDDGLPVDKPPEEE